MRNKKLFIRSTAITLIFIGAFGLYEERTWISNKGYRATINALGPENAVVESWALISLFATMVIVGFIVFMSSLRRKRVKN